MKLTNNTLKKIIIGVGIILLILFSVIIYYTLFRKNEGFQNKNNKIPIPDKDNSGNSAIQQIVKIYLSEDETKIYNGIDIVSNYGEIGDWDTSQVTDMSTLFKGYTNFNEDISKWDTSKVTNMSYMFYNATNFNQNINELTDYCSVASNISKPCLNKSQCVNKDDGTVCICKEEWFGACCDELFHSETTAGKDLCAKRENLISSNPKVCWDTSQVIDMSYMFYNAKKFNNGDTENNSNNYLNWNTGKVTNMGYMFYNATNFNQNIVKWNVSNVENMSYMFCNATNFNKAINGKGWNTSKVTNMSYMFYNATNFNKYIGYWNVSNVENMTYMFHGATNFNNGDTENKGNKPLDWDTSNVLYMGWMFKNAINFNQYISSWDTSQVTYMKQMFFQAEKFNNGDTRNEGNKPLNWDVSNVENMYAMFYKAEEFNQEISSWNTSKVINMESMFGAATNFNNGDTENKGNKPLDWDVSNVKKISYMFNGATNFNQDISNWDICNIEITNIFNNSKIENKNKPCNKKLIKLTNNNSNTNEEYYGIINNNDYNKIINTNTSSTISIYIISNLRKNKDFEILDNNILKSNDGKNFKIEEINLENLILEAENKNKELSMPYYDLNTNLFHSYRVNKIDGSILKGRIVGTIDYYSSVNTDLDFNKHGKEFKFIGLIMEDKYLPPPTTTLPPPTTTLPPPTTQLQQGHTRIAPITEILFQNTVYTIPNPIKTVPPTTPQTQHIMSILPPSPPTTLTPPPTTTTLSPPTTTIPPPTTTTLPPPTTTLSPPTTTLSPTEFTYYSFSNNNNEKTKNNTSLPYFKDNTGIVIDDYNGVLNIFYPYLV